MRASIKAHLTVPGKPSVEIGGGTKNHANLKNLGFEESGHTGFQPALSDEQMKNIDAVADLKENVPRLIRKITVEEDVASVTISTDEEGNPFKLTDFEVRFSGKHTGTMWMQLGKSEKYVSTNQINNNQGLPFYSTVSHSYKNAVTRFIFSGSNFSGIKYEQMIGNLEDGKYTAGAGSVAPFNTSPVSSPASQVEIKAISTNGVIKAGTVIEIWGY